MTTSMPTISLVEKLKAESVGELAKITLQENTSSNIPTQFPNILPRAPTATGGALSTNSTSFFPSSLQPQQPDTPNLGSRYCGRGIPCTAPGLQDPKGLKENKQRWLATYQLCDLQNVS